MGGRYPEHPPVDAVLAGGIAAHHRQPAVRLRQQQAVVARLRDLQERAAASPVLTGAPDVAAAASGRPPEARRAQRLSMKVKSPESLPLSRTAETSFPSAISLSTSARERPQPSAIRRTGRTGIRAAKRTETSITSRSR